MVLGILNTYTVKQVSVSMLTLFLRMFGSVSVFERISAILTVPFFLCKNFFLLIVNSHQLVKMRTRVGSWFSTLESAPLIKIRMTVCSV